MTSEFDTRITIEPLKPPQSFCQRFQWMLDAASNEVIFFFSRVSPEWHLKNLQTWMQKLFQEIISTWAWTLTKLL